MSATPANPPPVAPTSADNSASPDASASAAAKGRKRVKKTFMLHSPDANFKCLGRFSSVDARNAALKAASRGQKIADIYDPETKTSKIWLRRTNTKTVREYEGAILELDTPQVIKRAGREVKYSKKPSVTFKRQFEWTGEIDATTDAAAEAETEAAEAK